MQVGLKFGKLKGHKSKESQIDSLIEKGQLKRESELWKRLFTVRYLCGLLSEWWLRHLSLTRIWKSASGTHAEIKQASRCFLPKRCHCTSLAASKASAFMLRVLSKFLRPIYGRLGNFNKETTIMHWYLYRALKLILAANICCTRRF